MDDVFRPMRASEHEVINAMLRPLFPGRQGLSEQLRTAQVRVVDGDGSMEFLVRDCADISEVAFLVPVEAEYEDPDGVVVHALLRICRPLPGQPHFAPVVKEIEFYREDGQTVRSHPDPSRWRVYAPRSEDSSD